MWFRRLSIEEGLASTYVTSILQDRHGFMWVGTWKGLCRYDGYQFKTYRNDPADSLSLGDATATALLEDRKGRLWVGTTKGVDCLDPATETFAHYLQGNFDSEHPWDNWVSTLSEDKQGRIWVATYHGLFCIWPETGKVTPYHHNPGDPASLSDNRIVSLCTGSDGALWVGTGDGLNRLDLQTGKCRRFGRAKDAPLSDTSLSSNYIRQIKEGQDYLLYIMTGSGLDVYDLKQQNGRFVHYSTTARAFLQDKLDNSWWLGNSSGLSHLPGEDFSTQQPERLSYVPGDPDGLSSSSVTCLFQDREGTIWIGTNKGLNLYTPEARQFRHFKKNAENINSLSDNLVYSVYPGRDNTVWIATSEGGLNSLNPASGIIHRYPFDQTGSRYATQSKRVFRVYEDKLGGIWAGLRDLGLDRLDRTTGAFTHFRWRDSRDFVSFFYEDKDSTLWIGHNGGVSRYDRPTRQFEFFSIAKEGASTSGVITGILQDHTGAYWVSSNEHYLNRFDPANGHYDPILPDPAKPGSISSYDIQAIYEDKKGQLWVGTDKGLDRYDRQKGTFRHFGLREGLPDLMMGHLLEDGKGNLWIATGRGITCFNPETETFRNYTLMDGLSSNESWDFVKNPNTGDFLLATADGLTIFNPDKLQDNENPPPVVFTRFARMDTKSGKILEEKGITEKDALEVSYREDALMVEFAAMSFRKAAKNQYAYKLEGLNKDWIPLGTKHEITLTNLPPRTYLLRVKASNGDGVWNETGAALKITVTPPWWATWWAWLAYVAAALGILLLIYRFQLSRKLAAAENRRLKELDAVKTRLYTNITHEFRTPLTVIAGMADQIAENPGRWLPEGVQSIKRNSEQLLRLVNQLLDLRKLEAGKMPLRLVQGDVLAYLRYLVESFHSQARAKQVKLDFAAALPELVMDYDPDKLQQIVSNLLSNAIKFTPTGGEVVVRADLLPAGNHGGPLPVTGSAAHPRRLSLTVQDTGIGIPLEKQPFVFDRFYQADDSHTRPGEGTGVGLALTRELVHLLGGEISVQSEPGKGTGFTVTLPAHNRATFSAPIPPVASVPVSAGQGLPDATALIPTNGEETIDSARYPQVLLIEDNPDVVRYLHACLENDYQLQIAWNGREGIDKAIASVPDLIICDVMMPEKDGYEVCETLKNDERSSHIPIILLTAKADADSRLEGLRCGADAYMAKPFDKDELRVRIQNLLNLRQKLQQHYLSGTNGRADKIPETQLSEEVKKEAAFVQKARAIVEKHLDDSSFSMVELCHEMAMSRSQLHRKLSALTGLSPNPFIRHLRLEKARQLLADTDFTVAEVAYRTGFNDPDYFARVFSKLYDKTPSEHREMARKEGG